MGMASPYRFRLRQPNGTLTPYLMAHGGPGFHYMTDVDGYIVVEDNNDTVVYASMDYKTGTIVPSTMVVGSDSPKHHGVHDTNAVIGTRRLSHAGHDDPALGRTLQFLRLSNSSSFPSRRLKLPSTLKNLVILVRFRDHENRPLPPREDLDVLFNKVGGDKFLAPTGSIRDVYTANSYGKFFLESTIIDWLDLSRTEAYYAGGVSGVNTDRYFQALHEALDILENRADFAFNDFDADRDGRVDMVTLLHSGYAAEIPGKDVTGATIKNRIWSHRWYLPSRHFWNSAKSSLQVHQYSTSPALFALSGDEIGRIGVISHEIGHCLDLPDLYGLMSGSGIGSYDLLSNHWGFGPYALRQFYPPMMSPWSKIQVGWVEPTVISESGRYNLEASATHDKVYKIDIGNQGNEYLLIENRQKMGFDQYLPQPGLAIWHIDETARGEGGFPGQPGWPGNGKHYRVALLQADGEYDLEKGNHQGDSGDLFHEGGVSSLLPSESVTSGPFPNTDAYQDGFLSQTGIKITDISKAGPTMTFSVSFPGSPHMSRFQELRTTFAGGNGAAGNMFDIQPLKNMTIHALELHTHKNEVIIVEVWTKPGSYIGFDKDPIVWTRILAKSVHGEGKKKITTVGIGKLQLEGGKIQSIYVATHEKGGLRYTNGIGAGSIAVSNEDLIVYEGIGKPSLFGYSFQNRIWNGGLHYTVEEIEPEPVPISVDPRRLKTTYAGGTGQSGNMFDVRALKTIVVTGFDIHMFDESEVEVNIYTKVGTFVGSEKNCSEWKIVKKDMPVVGAGMGNPTFVDLTSSSILMPRGRQQAFYVTLPAGRNLRYTIGTETGSIYASDGYVEVHEGVGKTYPCGRTFWNRVWNGAVHYVEVEGDLSPPGPGLPLTDHWRMLELTFIGEENAMGSLFNIQSKTGLSLVGLGLRFNSTALHTVELLSSLGESHSASGQELESWTTLVSTELLGMGEEQETSVPINSFPQVIMEEGDGLGLLLRLSADGIGDIDGFVGMVVPTSNDDLIVSSSVQAPKEIFTQKKLRMWKAVFKYLIVDM